MAGKRRAIHCCVNENRSVMIVSHSQRIKKIAALVLWLEDSEFKSFVSIEPDLMSGMVVEQEGAPAHARHRGHTVYFCDVGCGDEFLATSEQYLVNSPQA